MFVHQNFKRAVIAHILPPTLTKSWGQLKPQVWLASPLEQWGPEETKRTTKSKPSAAPAPPTIWAQSSQRLWSQAPTPRFVGEKYSSNSRPTYRSPRDVSLGTKSGSQTLAPTHNACFNSQRLLTYYHLPSPLLLSFAIEIIAVNFMAII